MKSIVSAVALVTAMCAAPAGAVSLALAGSGTNTGGASYWTESLTFELPLGAGAPTLNISFASADDRMVVQLNGSDIISTGIYGYAGNGTFRYTADGPNDPHFFLDNGAQNFNISCCFGVGTNTLTFILNDTGTGILGDLTNGPDGPAGPTGYSFAGTITYVVANPVPEPAAWALMMLGFGLVGGAMRRWRDGGAPLPRPFAVYA